MSQLKSDKYILGIKMLPLAETYISKINGDNQKIRAFIERQWVPVHVLELVYFSLSGEGSFPRLEDLEKEEKTRIWNTVCSWVKECTKDEKVSRCRALYLIEQITQQKVSE
jgi:hypothetical protein